MWSFPHQGGPPLSFLPNLHPSLPLSSWVLPFLLPILLLRGGGPLVGGRKRAFGTESAEVLREVRNPGHPSCRWKFGTQSPPSPHCPAPAPCQAQRGPVLHTSRSTVQPAQLAGTGEEAPGGSTEEPDTQRGGEGLHLSDVPCDCLGVGWAPWK